MQYFDDGLNFVMQCLRNFFESDVVQEFFPFVSLKFKATRIRRRMALDSASYLASNQKYVDWKILDIDILDKLLEQEAQRTKSIDDKTAKMFPIFGIALTVTSTYLAAGATAFGTAWKPIWSPVLWSSFAFFTIGACIAFYSMKNRIVYGIGPDWEVSKNQSENPKIIIIDALGASIDLNILIALYNEATSQCMRNGFILLIVGIILAALQPNTIGLSKDLIGALLF